MLQDRKTVWAVAAALMIGGVAEAGKPRPTTPWQAKQTAKTYTALSLASDSTINPLRGYYRWRGWELVPQSAPALDAYQRYTWNTLETGPGQYDFSAVLNDIQTARSQGRKFALRLRSMVGYEDGQIYLPADLAGNANCQRGCGWWADTDSSDPDNTYVPDWNDPYLQQRARAMLTALAQAIGNDETIAWIDVGMYGQYGEWALSSSVNYATAPNGIVAATNASKREFAKMHFEAFPARQLVMFALYSSNDALHYGLLEQTITQKPVGLRVDCLGRASFFNQWLNHPVEWAQYSARWQRAPFVAEFCPFVPGDAVDNPAVALQQVRDFHVSAVGNGNLAKDISSSQSWAAFNANEQADLLQIGREAGYRLLAESSKVTLAGDGSLSISLTLRNDGNAPVYEPWDAMLELSNASGQIVWSANALFDLPILIAAGNNQNRVVNTLLSSGLPTGDYTLRLNLRDSRRVNAGVTTRAVLKPANTERNSDGSLTFATLHRN